MRKYILLIILLSIQIQAQQFGFGWGKGTRIPAWAVDLDGSTEYMSKTSPVNLDLNGSEMISKWADRNFSSKDSLTWTGSGTHTIDTSSTDKRTGTFSGKAVATAAGDSTTNYITLPASSFQPIVAGKKYTLGGWARANTAGSKITTVVGSKGKLSGTLSTVAGTFTKVVHNFQATLSEVNQGIRIYLNQADSVYLDDWSISEAMDATVLSWVYSNASQTAWICGSNVSASPAEGFGIYQTSLNLQGAISDNVARITGLKAFSINQWTLVVVTYDRTALVSTYINAGTPATNDITGVGKVLIQSTKPFALGSTSTGSSLYNGKIGETQIIRGYALTAAEIQQVYLSGMSASYSGYAPVFWFNPKQGGSDALMLQDYSGTGNNLTGTNITTADRVSASYPTK